MSLEGVDELELVDIGGDQDPLPVSAELQPRPLAAGVVLSDVEGGKGSLDGGREDGGTYDSAFE